MCGSLGTGVPSWCTTTPWSNRAPASSSAETNCELAEASTVTAPPGRPPEPTTVNGSRPRPSSSIRAPRARRASSTGAIGRLRACGSPSKDTRPAASAATGGRNRITVPASPQSTVAVAAQGRRGDQPVGRLGVVAVEVLDARAQGAQGLRHQQRVAGAQRPAQPGACRWRARRARGSGWSATCCPGGRRSRRPARCAHGSGPVAVAVAGGGVHRGVRSGHVRSGERVVGVRRHQAGLAARAPGRVPRDLLGLALAECGGAPGVLGGALGPPRQTRLAGGVDRGEQQAAEQAEVLQEVLVWAARLAGSFSCQKACPA